MRFIFTLLVLWLFQVGDTFAGGRVALVIGNSTYRNVPMLPNPRNDAAAIGNKFRDFGFEVVVGLDLEMDKMRKIVREFIGKLENVDIAAFYYAGHGFQVDGENYMAPIDAKLTRVDDLDFEAMPLNQVIAAMERNSKTNLVFLDACRDNPLAQNLARSMGTRSTAVGRGLAPIGTGIGTLIAFSTQPGNVALDGDGVNSPYTTALLRFLGTPGEDIMRNLIRVRNDVLGNTEGRQVPWENSSLTGEIVLVAKQGMTPQTLADVELFELREAVRKSNEETSRKLEELNKERNFLQEKATKQREELDRLEKALREASVNDGDIFDGMSIADIENSDPGNLSAVANFSYGMKMLELNNYSVAAKHLLAAANSGEPKAMTEYGMLVTAGLGVEKDPALGHEWFIRSSEAGNPKALFLAGRNFERGDGGVKKDIEKAITYYKQSADAGYSDAMNNLGVLYLFGEGVRKSPKDAAYWYGLGAKQNNANALFNLGALQDEGNGVKKSPGQAAASVLASIAAGNTHALTEMQNNSQAWSQQFRLEFQKILSEKALYSGKIDGKFGSGTFAAINLFLRESKVGN
ncbi:MAG: caspase family protein [Nitratireductor sp.]